MSNNLLKHAYSIYETLYPPVTSEKLNAAIKEGLIPKINLLHGSYYYGTCRNASIARWDVNTQLFYHWRTKFGNNFIESIPHPEDCRGYDIFVPVKLMTEVEAFEIIKPIDLGC